MSRIAIVGSRPPPEEGHEHAGAWVRLVVAVAAFVESLPEGTVVVSGGARGIDREAAKAARARGLVVVEHRPEIAKFPSPAAALMARNTTIVQDADEVHAFPSAWSRGTWDTVGKARASKRTVVHTVLRVQTARLSYGGPFRLDVTAKSGGAEGAPFAPPWSILRPAIDARREAERLMAEAKRLAALPETDRRESEWDYAKAAEEVEARAWAEYVPRYVAAMRESARKARGAWDRLLAGDKVTLVCYCTDPTQCHRTILAELLTKFGATYLGEVQ